MTNSRKNTLASLFALCLAVSAFASTPERCAFENDRGQNRPAYSADATVLFRYDAAAHRMMRIGFAASFERYVSISSREVVTGPHGVVVTSAGDAFVTSMLVGQDRSGSVVVAVPISRTADIVSVTLAGLQDIPGTTEMSTSVALDAREVLSRANDGIKSDSCLDQSDSHYMFPLRNGLSLCIDCVQTCIGEYCGGWYNC